MGAGSLGLAGELDAVPGVVGADPGDDVGAVADGLEHGAYELVLLRVAGGGRLAGGAVDDEAVVAGVDEVGGEPLGAVEVERAVRSERRDHRGEDPPEGGLGVEIGAMGPTLLAAQRTVCPRGTRRGTWQRTRSGTACSGVQAAPGPFDAA